MAEPPAKKQIDKFKEAARDLECEDSEGPMLKALKKLIKAPPKEKGGKG